MEFKELLLKMAKNEPLTPRELQELDILSDQIQKSSNDLNGILEGKKTLSGIKIENPDWIGSPLGAWCGVGGLTTTSGIGNAVPFLEKKKSKYFVSDPSDDTIVRVTYPEFSYQVSGVATFTDNAVGVRQVGIYGYDSNGSTIDSIKFNQMAVTEANEVTYVPVSFVMNSYSFIDLRYIVASLYQTSGSPLSATLALQMFVV